MAKKKKAKAAKKAKAKTVKAKGKKSAKPLKTFLATQPFVAPVKKADAPAPVVLAPVEEPPIVLTPENYEEVVQSLSRNELIQACEQNNVFWAEYNLLDDIQLKAFVLRKKLTIKSDKLIPVIVEAKVEPPAVTRTIVSGKEEEKVEQPKPETKKAPVTTINDVNAAIDHIKKTINRKKTVDMDNVFKMLKVKRNKK